MSKAVIYARFSSDRQRSESIEQQIHVCTEFCNRNKLSVVATYADNAITGRTDERPQFQQMIRDSKARTFDTVVVYALDRFSRSVYDSCVYEDLLHKNGVKLLSATEPLTDDPSGILVKQIFRGFSEYYSAELSAKIHRGLENNATKFLATGSVPYGFLRSTDGHYVVNDKEAVIVREIFDRVSRSEPLVSIYTDLNNRGIGAKHGQWTKSTIGRLLTNKRYIGTYIWKETETEDVIPAIVSKDVFWKVQEMIKEKPRGQRTGRRTPNGEYHLTGRLYCECGCHMVGISGTRRDGNLDFYYSCSGKREHTGCNKKNVRRDYIERKIADTMNEMCMDDDCIRWIAEQAYDREKQRETESDIEILKQKLKSTKEIKANATKAVLSGIITDELKETIMNADVEEHSIEYQLKELEESKEQILSVDELTYFLKQYRTIGTEMKAIQYGLIDAFVTRVELSDEQMKIYFTVKKEDRQAIVPLDGQGLEGGSYKTTMWRENLLIRTDEYFCIILSA